eukprot:7391845-Prymnesium_polylepis.1
MHNSPARARSTGSPSSSPLNGSHLMSRCSGPLPMDMCSQQMAREDIQASMVKGPGQWGEMGCCSTDVCGRDGDIVSRGGFRSVETAQ